MIIHRCRPFKGMRISGTASGSDSSSIGNSIVTILVVVVVSITVDNTGFSNCVS